MITSNSSLSLVQGNARSLALQSFTFFANSVLAARLAEDLCTVVQDVVDDRADYFIRSRHPRMLCAALNAWLQAQGVHTLCSVKVPTHETLQWLGLDSSEDAQQQDAACVLDLRSDGVDVRWV